MEAATKCNVVGCGKPHAARGLCESHYKRLRRHGHIDATRPSDWGRRSKHPLYSIWKTLFRNNGGPNVSQAWRDFWTFVEDVGERPSLDHDIGRKDAKMQFSKENCYWRKKRIVWSEGNVSAQKIAYHRMYYAVNRDKVQDYDMRKNFGISFETYRAMLDAQGGVCAICKRVDPNIDQKTGNRRRLAIDHCHTSGKVRGLLCGPCNASLGGFRDDIAVMETAIAYLKRHGSSEPPA